MNFDDFLKYEHTVERMGKAKAMSFEQQEKYADKMTELRTALTDDFNDYYEYYITGGSCDLADVERRIIGCFIKMRKAIASYILEGDLNSAHTGLIEMRFILCKLRGKEYAMPEFKRE